MSQNLSLQAIGELSEALLRLPDPPGSRSLRERLETFESVLKPSGILAYAMAKRSGGVLGVLCFPQDIASGGEEELSGGVFVYLDDEDRYALQHEGVQLLADILEATPTPGFVAKPLGETLIGRRLGYEASFEDSDDLASADRLLDRIGWGPALDTFKAMTASVATSPENSSAAVVSAGMRPV